MKITSTNCKLFSPPFMQLKKEIYKARQKIDVTIYASERFINGFEILAEEMLPTYIKEYNDLVEQFNKMESLSKLKLLSNKYNSGERYSHY